jgi:hypothetical protein
VVEIENVVVETVFDETRGMRAVWSLFQFVEYQTVRLSIDVGQYVLVSV